MSIICLAVCMYLYCETLFTSRGLIVFVKQTGDLRSHVQIIECLHVTTWEYLGEFSGVPEIPACNKNNFRLLSWDL